MRRELVRFLLVGFTTVAIDFIAYRLLVAGDLNVSLAKGAGFVTGTVFAYFANKLWTFNRPEAGTASGSALRFALLYGATLLCNVAVNAILLATFQDLSFVFQGAFVVATGVSATLNFLGMKYFVFAQRPLGSKFS